MGQSPQMMAHWTGKVLATIGLIALSAALLYMPAARAEAAGASVVLDGGDDGGGLGALEDDDDEVKGVLLAVPDSFPLTFEGTWTLRVRDSSTVTVFSNIQTRFDTDALSDYKVGAWVEIRGARQPDGSIVAQRIRPDDHEAGELIIRLESGAYSTTLASKYNLALKSTLLEDGHVYLYTTDEDSEQELADKVAADSQAGVVWAELNFVSSAPEGDGYKTWGWGGPDEPGEYSGQSAFGQVGLSDAARSATGAGVTVAVLDTGIYLAHEQFTGRLLTPSLDVVDDDKNADDLGPGAAWGHGTHVAGIIAQMAPGATLLPIRVLDPDGRGNSFLVAYAMEWAVQHGARVINMSLGTEGVSRLLCDVAKQAVDAGVVLVAAAGNRNSSTVQYPAACPGVIAVTAVDKNNVKATFANYGTGWVDLASPGVAVMSTMIAANGAGYATWSGTSMSAAFVSGAAALIVGQTAESGSEQSLHELLVETGTDIDDANSAHAGQIGRLLNVSRALGVDDEVPVKARLFLPTTQR